MRSGGLSARAELRLDPFALPACFEAADAGADGLRKAVELHRQRVVVRRTVDGMRMALNMPVANFRGIALRVLPPEGDTQAAVTLVLEHNDPALALPLFISSEGGDVAALWKSWSAVLGVPQIVDDVESGFREPFAEKAAPAAKPCPRRRRRSALRNRRPSFLMRRRCGLAAKSAVRHDEREIIARN